jgi:prevent-host-death family protein
MGTAKIVDIHEAKMHLSRLIDQALAGEEIVIAKAGKPLVKLVPVESCRKPRRVLGRLAGQFVVPDDFDDPLPDEVLALFYGRDDQEPTEKIDT